MRYLAQTAAPNELNMGLFPPRRFELNMGRFLHAHILKITEEQFQIKDRHVNQLNAINTRDTLSGTQSTAMSTINALAIATTRASGHCSHTRTVNRLLPI